MKNKSELLKVIAILSMIIDHIGLVFFPEIEAFRILGRLAFPIFAYQITIGFKHTSNINKYISRMAVFAIISLIPYWLLFNTNTLNVLVTFTLGLLIIYLIDVKKFYLGALLTLLPLFVEIDYGLYGILMILFFHYIRHNKLKLIIISLLTIINAVLVGWFIQVYAIIAVGMVLIDYKPKINIRLNKYVFYWFYPVHMTVLYIIRFYL